MNAIYEKLKTKRRYKRKPMCANINGICEWDKCRCDMAIKKVVSKYEPIIDNHLHHREKVVETIRRRQLQELDVENTIHSDFADATIYAMEAKGEWAKRREQKKIYIRMIWRATLIIISIPILYIIVINVLGI